MHSPTCVHKKYCIAYDTQVHYTIGYGIFYNRNQLLIVALVYHGTGTIYTILDKRHFCFTLPTFPSLKCDGKKFSFARLPHWAGSIEGLTSKWRHQQKADFAPKMWVRPSLVTMKFIFTEGDFLKDILRIM